jgi:hypothetical protein
MREKLLRIVGCGDLYDQLRQDRLDRAEDVGGLLSENARLRNEINSASVRTEEPVASVMRRLRDEHRIIELDYPARPVARHGWGKPDDKRLTAVLAKRDDSYRKQAAKFADLTEALSKIDRLTDDPTQPHWKNDWFPVPDAVSLYGFVVERNPAKLLEIGSGTSTKFARRAVSDHGLRTRIVSIDPQPRSEIDAICDAVIRFPLEDAPIDEFDSLAPNDILFFDGSHRTLQNSDVTVFFTEILPSLPSGLLVGIHDIFLPADYPPVWSRRYYSEQYLLACWLLAGDRLQVEFPVWYCFANGLLDDFQPLLDGPNLADCTYDGGAFWFTIR